jgi:hypothetical protein
MARSSLCKVGRELVAHDSTVHYSLPMPTKRHAAITADLISAIGATSFASPEKGLTWTGGLMHRLELSIRDRLGRDRAAVYASFLDHNGDSHTFPLDDAQQAVRLIVWSQFFDKRVKGSTCPFVALFSHEQYWGPEMVEALAAFDLGSLRNAA